MSTLFQKRSSEPELMDDLLAGGSQMDQTLRELEIINRLLGGNYVTINGLSKLISSRKGIGKLTIVDIGCGGGDMLKLIDRWAKKRDIEVELIGVDANPHVIDFARKNTADYSRISYKVVDIFSEDFLQLKFDIVTATLFTHHFTKEQLISLFKHFKAAASLGMVINDLHRHWFAYHSINTLTALFSKSPMVKNDAGISVLRAFHKNELEDILQKSSIQKYRLRWFWAFRWQLVCEF